MMELLISCLLLGAVTHAQSDQPVVKIRSDCKAIEMKTLRNQAIIDRISPGAKLVEHDCSVARTGSKSEKLIVVYHLNAANGVESRVAVFSRSSLDKSSRPRFVSQPIGFDSYPFKVDERHRLLFIKSSEGGKVRFYTDTQTDANTDKFLEHELNLSAKSMTDVADHAWPVSAAHEPQVMKEKGKWRVIVGDKIVDL